MAQNNSVINSVNLWRFRSSEKGTLGEIRYIKGNGVCIFYSLELPWRNNEAVISSIPAGEYECKLVSTSKTKSGKAYQVMNVPGRTGILIHVGNTISDTHGCILIGSHMDYTDKTLSKSQVAFDAFMVDLNGNPFTLKIHNN